jgi:hypothetical protein
MKPGDGITLMHILGESALQSHMKGIFISLFLPCVKVSERGGLKQFSWLGTDIFTWRKVRLRKVSYMKMLRKRCLKTVIFVLESREIWHLIKKTEFSKTDTTKCELNLLSGVKIKQLLSLTPGWKSQPLWGVWSALHLLNYRVHTFFNQMSYFSCLFIHMLLKRSIQKQSLHLYWGFFSLSLYNHIIIYIFGQKRPSQSSRVQNMFMDGINIKKTKNTTVGNSSKV